MNKNRVVLLSFLIAFIITACEATPATTSTSAPASPTASAVTPNASPLPAFNITPPPVVPAITGLPVIQATAINPQELLASQAAPTSILPTATVNLPAVEQAIADLASRLNIQAAAITVVRVENVDFPDPSLGLPDPDKAYAQVITPGQRLILAYNGKTYEYRVAGRILKFAGEVQP